MPSLGGLAGALYNMGQMAREDKLRQLATNKETQDRTIRFYEQIVGNETLDPQVRERAFGVLGEIIGQGPDKFKAERYSPQKSLGLDEFYQQTVIGAPQQQQGQQAQPQGRPTAPPMPTPLPPPGVGALPEPMQFPQQGMTILGRGGFGGVSTPTFTGEDIVYGDGGQQQPRQSLFIDKAQQAQQQLQQLFQFFKSKGMDDYSAAAFALGQNPGRPQAPEADKPTILSPGQVLLGPDKKTPQFSAPFAPKDDKRNAVVVKGNLVDADTGEVIFMAPEGAEEGTHWQQRSETDAQGNVREWWVNPVTRESTEPVNKGRFGKPSPPPPTLGAGSELTPRQLSASMQLANSLKAHPMYTDMLDISTGMQGVTSGLMQKNGLGDIAAINAFQRMVDPGATVREGDVQLIQSASGLLQKILSDYPVEKLRSGAALPDGVRQNMLKAARDLYAVRSKNYDTTVGEQYRKLSAAAGIPFEYIGQDFATTSGSFGGSATPPNPPTGAARPPLSSFEKGK